MTETTPQSPSKIAFPAFVAMCFLNAFVDLGHKITIQNTIFKAYDGPAQIVLTAIINGLILLPFVLLFVPAGRIADRFAKPRVMQVSAWLAVALTSGITLFYMLGWFWPAFAMTFLLAAQSAIYSPAKLGYIRELCGRQELARANSIVQIATTGAILAGTFAFSILFEQLYAAGGAGTPTNMLTHLVPIGWCLIIVSLGEVALAYQLPILQQPSQPTADKTESSSVKQSVTLLRNDNAIWLSIVGLAIFWSIAQVVLASFPAFAKGVHGIDNTVVIQGLLACCGIGLLIGAAIVARVSRNHIETGLVPIGAVGVAAVMLSLPILPATWMMAVDLIALGVLGALFVIPLNALIQYHAVDAELGRILAGSNLVQNSVMLGFLAATTILAANGMSGRGLFLVLGAIAIGGAVYTIRQLPHSLTRFVVSIIFGTKYRIQVVGFERLPAQGGVLLLGNHIS